MNCFVFFVVLALYFSVGNAQCRGASVVLDKHLVMLFNTLGIETPVSDEGELNTHVCAQEAESLFHRAQEILALHPDLLPCDQHEYIKACYQYLQQSSCLGNKKKHTSCGKPACFDTLCVAHSACVKNKFCVGGDLVACNVSAGEIDPELVTAQDASLVNFNTTYLTGPNAFIQNLSGVQTINGLDIAGLLAPAITGATGLTGYTGQQGAQGLTGVQGPQGAPGPQGIAFEQTNYAAVNKTTPQALTTNVTPIQYDAFELNDGWTTTDFQTFIIPTAGLYRFTYSITYTSTVNLSFVSNVFINSFTVSAAQLGVTDNTPNQVRTISTSFLERVFSPNSTLIIRVVTGNNPANISGLPVVSSFSATRL